MKSAPSAESLFKTLKAENEPWLGDVFVSLPAFESLKQGHSTILYGEAGSGKTAARLALSKERNDKIFHALWQPEPAQDESAAGTALAAQAMEQALRACVEGLVSEGNLHRRIGEPSGYIASALQSFLRNYLPFDAVFYIQDQANRLSQDEVQWYLKLLEQTFPALKEGAGFKDKIRLLLAVLRAAKYERLWLAVDGLERWTPLRAGEQVGASLEAFLSTLVYFDLPDVAFKFFVPASFKTVFRKTGGVERYRAMEIEINWSAEALLQMLEKRLTRALSSKKASLSALCDQTIFLNWLKEYGGTSPRAWLSLTAPLAAEFQRSGTPLNAAQTREFIRAHPAPLRFDAARREVRLGEKRILITSPLELRALEYLVSRPQNAVSLEELYYYVYKELDTIPDKGAPDWTHPNSWRGAMDNVLLRARKKIEPDPKKPIYLITERKHGVTLMHAEV